METTTSIEGRCRSRRRRSVGWKPGLRAWLASIAAVLMIASSSVAADPRAFSVELLFDGEAVSLGKVWRGPGTPESDRGFVEDRLPQGSLYYVVYGGGGEGLDATDPWKLGAPVLAKGLLGDPCLRVVEMYDQNTGTWKGQTLRGAKGRTLVRVGEKPVPERLVVYRREARDRTDRKPPRVLLNATLSDGGRPGTSFPSNVVHGGSATSNKIGIVLLGDGFLSADLAAGGTYDQLCKKFGQTLLETEPFASYGHLLRIVRVDVPSNGVGIGMQGAVPVDNFFGTILTQTPDEAAPAASGDEGGDWRWARLADTGIEKALQVNPDVPRAVAVVVLNDASISAEVRGGGGPCPVVAVTTRAPGPQFLHGLGHALGMLGDEMGGPAACPGKVTHLANVDTAGAGRIKWQRLIDAGALGSPKTGALWCNDHVQPGAACVMGDQFASSTFCAACSEAIVRGFYRRVSLVERSEPADRAPVVAWGSTARFTVVTTSRDKLKIEAEWHLDRVKLAPDKGEVSQGRATEGHTFTLAPSAKVMTPGLHVIQCFARDRTPVFQGTKTVLPDDESFGFPHEVRWDVTVKATANELSPEPDGAPFEAKE